MTSSPPSSAPSIEVERSGAAERARQWRPDRLPVFLGLLLPIAVFTALAVLVSGRRGGWWDARLLRFAERHYQMTAVDLLDNLLRGAIGAGAIVAAVAVIAFLVARRGRYALVWALGVGGAFALDTPLKELFRRPALGGTGGYSFPSGGAMASAAVLLALLLTLPTPWPRWLLRVGVPVLALEGVALVYAWWHYPTDVLAGWCFGVFWVTGCWLALLGPRRRTPSAAGGTRAADS
jgi:membrane-associated phospholipid phosphatase